MWFSQGSCQMGVKRFDSEQRFAIPATLSVLWLLGVAGCGGGGGGNSSSGKPTGLTAGTPATVTGSAANGLTLTFSESLTTLNGAPAVTYALHEVNNGSVSVDVVAAMDSTTHDLYPVLNVRILDPQGHALSIPHYTGSQTLTLTPGATADTSLTYPLSDFQQKGSYSTTAISTGTDAVSALATPLILNAG